MTINGEIKKIIPQKGAWVFVPMQNTHILKDMSCNMVDVRLCDGRCISPEQTAKAKILTNAIANYTGYHQFEIDQIFKYQFCMDNQIEYFSLADCEMRTAYEYITFLVDWCMDNSVPVKMPTDRFIEDWHRFIYKSIENRLCAVSGLSGAEIHHCTGSRVGMGRDRRKILHEGLICIPLLPQYHDECHRDEVKFMEKYKLFGIELDKHLCECLGWQTEVD